MHSHPYNYSPSLAEEYEQAENKELLPLNMKLESEAGNVPVPQYLDWFFYYVFFVALDPPDEVIPPKQATTSNSPAQASLATFDSKLNHAVGAFIADGVWRLRTVLALLCAIGVVWLESNHQLVYSGVVLMATLDSALLFYVVLSPPLKFITAGNPLGMVSLLKIPLMVVHSTSAKWFDTACLSILLIALILRDILLMIFTSIVLKCVFHFMSSEA